MVVEPADTTRAPTLSGLTFPSSHSLSRSHRLPPDLIHMYVYMYVHVCVRRPGVEPRCFFSGASTLFSDRVSH